MPGFLVQIKNNWAAALGDPNFRKRLIPGCLLLISVLSSFPFFFQAIEKRNGTLLDDWILQRLPSVNLSVAIFVIIWTIGLLAIIRAMKDPNIFLIFSWSYVFVSLFRALAITFIPLNPPVGLVQLIDPLSNTFYGHAIITKDLFFSGHTSTIFLIFLTLKKKEDKILTLAATFFLAILLMLQHIHYAVDILAAPAFTYLSYLIGRRIVIGKIGRNSRPESAEIFD